MKERKNELTLEDLWQELTRRFETAELFYGHGTDNAEDEALALLFTVLNIPYSSGEGVLKQVVPASQYEKILQLAEQRICENKPLPYLTHKAYFAGMEFYVDERVIIPRSPFAELIEQHFVPWVAPDKVMRILDLCTGSGCMAIACAKFFPHAKVDAVDISQDALAVARLNVEKYQMMDQVNLIQSDLFKQLENTQYDLIISNPPYVSESEKETLPKEFFHEPEIALFAEQDGLKLTYSILDEAKKHLTDQGVLIVEVGNSQYALEQTMPQMPFIWLEFERGGHGVFLLTADQLSS